MSNELYLTAMREKGLADAADLQGRAAAPAHGAEKIDKTHLKGRKGRKGRQVCF